MQVYRDVIDNGQSGVPVAGCQVLVKTYPDGSLATLLDASGNSLGNPFTSSDGSLAFQAANGKYTITVSGGGIVTPVVTPPITLYDPADAPPATLTALSASGGSALVGNGGETVADSLNALQLADYTELRAYAGPRKSVYVTGYLGTAAPSGIAGMFVRDDSDTTTADNGGTVIVASNGKRWKRRGDAVNVWHFMTAAQLLDAQSGAPSIDHTTCFVNARAAAAAGGVPLVVPDATYRINDTSQFPDSSNTAPLVRIEMGSNVKFVGTFSAGNWFSVPTLGHSKGNGYNLISGSYETAAPSSALEDPGAAGTYPFGQATRTIECVPEPTFKGNADALFAQTTGKSGVNASLGAINALTQLFAGFLGNGNAAEFDIDNFAADLKGLGVVIQGVGTYRVDSGVKVVRIPYGSQSTSGAGGQWIPPYQYGIYIANAEQGIVIDQSQVQNPQHAIMVKPGPQRAADQPAIALMTPDGNVVFYVRADGYIAPRASAAVSSFGTNVAGTGVANQNPTQYLRADGFVQLAGWVIATTGTVAAGTTLFTIDASYRPNRTVIVPVMFNNGAASWLQITVTGVVTCGLGLGTSAALDLNCISYRLTN